MTTALAVRANEGGTGRALQPRADLQSLLTGGRVLFRSTALGPTYGLLSVVASANPAGARATTDQSCERVYATTSDAVCITARRGATAGFGLQMLDAALHPATFTALAGLPSRARLSPDGSLVATTTFINGRSYAESSFSTRTVVSRTDGSRATELRSFTTTVEGRPLMDADRNFWGVTFGDDTTFYATAAVDENTWLVRGDLMRRTMTSVRSDAECPSISPDGRRVAYKVRQARPGPGQWQFAVLDLATGVQTLLPTPIGVDDQPEWLDDDDILYTRTRPGPAATTSDIWRVRADGRQPPTIFIPQASSPAVVRT